ncbi:hypothetical protein C8R47DRAFT_744080 [Mycena vitilis]|nr:hypothetical protein C8R47DRAFT_744080 [Mycena vitilis]
MCSRVSNASAKQRITRYFAVSRWFVYFSHGALPTTMSASRISFPENPNRPQHVGRGHRKSVATPGLVNHNIQQEKNQLMARRAADTRRLRNEMAHQQELTPSAPLGPTTAQNRPPQTPAATVHPDLRSFPSQNTSSPFQTMSSSPPFNFDQTLFPPAQAPTRASPPFNFDQTLFPPAQAPTRAPSLRPQNYQPAYPDFTQLTPFPSSDSMPAEQPSSSGPRLESFSRMMETLTPEQRAQVNEMFGMTLPPVAHAPHGLRSDSGADGNGNDGDDDAENEAMARGGNAWDTHPNNQDDEDEDEDRLHENAQTSLEVTMHDVQQKRKRSHLVPRWAAQESDGEESPSTAPAKKRRRKKRAHRRQKSRSIKELTPERRRLVETTYKFIGKRVVIEKPFPDDGESGDPGAEDDEFQTLIVESWYDALEYLDVDPNDVEELSMEEMLLIRSRIPQVRGHVMVEADKLVRSEYNFVDILSLDDPTPEKIAEVRESNRELVDKLDQVFMFKDIRDLATVGHHKIFQKLVNAAFFSKERKKRRSHYFDGLEALPRETFGLLMDAIVCGIDRWKTGEWEMVAFEAEVYRPIHRQSMIFIGKWIAEFDKDVYPENLAKARLREMLIKARYVDSIPLEILLLTGDSGNCLMCPRSPPRTGVRSLT